MQDYIGYKIQIYPNEQQIQLIKQFAGASRYAYNWALNIQNTNYENGNKYISGYELCKMFTQYKKDNQWLYDVADKTLKQSILDLDSTFKKFFKVLSKYPKYKTKKVIN